MTKNMLLSATIIVLGLALLAASAAWSWLVDPRFFWSERQAAARAEAGLQIEAVAHQLEQAATDEQRRRAERTVEEAEAKYRHIDAEFDRAQGRARQPVVVLRWSGTLCLALGVVLYYVLAQRDG